MFDRLVEKKTHKGGRAACHETNPNIHPPTPPLPLYVLGLIEVMLNYEIYARAQRRAEIQQIQVFTALETFFVICCLHRSSLFFFGKNQKII